MLQSIRKKHFASRRNGQAFSNFRVGNDRTYELRLVFHLMFIALIVVASVFLCVKCCDVSDKHFRRIVFISWIAIVVLEIYKQLVFSVEYTEGAFVWDYQWYAFPFQFCSSPLYALPFVALMPDGKLRMLLSASSHSSRFLRVLPCLSTRTTFSSTR